MRPVNSARYGILNEVSHRLFERYFRSPGGTPKSNASERNDFSILKRLLMLIPVLLGITLISFLLLQIVPGDPASHAMGTRASPEELQAMRELWGLDKPLWVQYIYFLRDCLTGSFGVSIFHKQPIIALVMERLPFTLAIVAYSTIIALLIALRSPLSPPFIAAGSSTTSSVRCLWRSLPSRRFGFAIC